MMSNLFPTYSRWEIEPESAEGSYLYGKDGKKYLDFTSGIGVNNLGHRPQAVKEAIQEQLNKFWHVSNLFPVELQETAAGKLAQAAEMDLVFFSNSGAEANEAAIKLARKSTGRKKSSLSTNPFMDGHTQRCLQRVKIRSKKVLALCLKLLHMCHLMI